MSHLVLNKETLQRLNPVQIEPVAGAQLEVDYKTGTGPKTYRCSGGIGCPTTGGGSGLV